MLIPAEALAKAGTPHSLRFDLSRRSSAKAEHLAGLPSDLSGIALRDDGSKERSEHEGMVWLKRVHSFCLVAEARDA